MKCKIRRVVYTGARYPTSKMAGTGLAAKAAVYCPGCRSAPTVDRSV
jgi:hypothetical protein